MTRCSLLPLILFAAHPAIGQEHGPARASLERFGAGLEGLHARFRQQVIAPEGRLEEPSEGEVWIRKPGLFRWEQGGEFPELIVADGERVWTYDQALEQVTVREQSGLMEDSPLLLITDLSGLEGQFTVTEAGDTEGMLLLELRVRDADAEFERVLIGLRDDVLALMALEDAFGIRTEITFEGIERNPRIADDLFRFKPPPGVDVIGDPGPP